MVFILMPAKKTSVFLTQSQEEQLIENWQEFYKLKDSQELLLAFRPLVLNVVKKYSHYGILREDLIQEAWLGLCVALCKYDSSRGVRFSSYARWWVNASCQDYVMRNWSIVRVGTTTTHKKLFFQLRYLKRSLEKIDTQYKKNIENMVKLCNKYNQIICLKHFCYDSKNGNTHITNSKNLKTIKSLQNEDLMPYKYMNELYNKKYVLPYIYE